MLVHSASDIFAHSTFKKNKNGNWKRIKHVAYSDNYKEADAPDFIEERYKDAKKF